MEVPSKASLDAMQARFGQPQSPTGATPEKVLSDGPPEMPDPEPEVLEAAKKLIEGMLQGQGFSEAVDALRGQRLTGAKPVPVVDERLKLEFLAHVLENKPYRQTYSLLRGKLVLVFQTVTAEIDRQIADAAWTRAKNTTERDMFYSHGLLAASLQSIVVNGQPAPTMQDEGPAQIVGWTSRFDLWSTSVDRPILQLVHNAFRRFERELQEMLEKADDPSFWPTP